MFNFKLWSIDADEFVRDKAGVGIFMVRGSMASVFVTFSSTPCEPVPYLVCAHERLTYVCIFLTLLVYVCSIDGSRV